MTPTYRVERDRGSKEFSTTHVVVAIFDPRKQKCQRCTCL